MGIFKQNYGRLGNLNRGEWKQYLNSNRGLFIRRVERAPDFVIGPTLDESGKVTADTETIEASFLGKVASKEQCEFWEELCGINRAAAHEYLLTIIGAIEIWKEDIYWFKEALSYLKKEEKTLETEERLTEEGKRINFAMKIPAVLKRHFPPLFEDIEIDNLDFERVLKKIREAEAKVRSKEHYIKKYLKEKKHEMPFLFKR